MTFLQSLLSAIGSHSSDIPGTESVDNPLPTCPSSPNCVRITKTIEAPMDSVFSASQKSLELMNPEEVTTLPDDYTICTVFRVFFFRDDFVLQLTQRDLSSTYLHVRSASRMGFSDLGVNSRRVKRFFKQLHRYL